MRGVKSSAGISELGCPNTDPSGNYGHNTQNQSPALGKKLQSPHLSQSWAVCQARAGIWGSGNVSCIVTIKFSGVILSSKCSCSFLHLGKEQDQNGCTKKSSRVSGWDLLHSETGFPHNLNQQSPNYPFNFQGSPGSNPTRQNPFFPSVPIPSSHRSSSKAVEQMICRVGWALQAFVLPWQAKPQSWKNLSKKYIWFRQSLINHFQF